MKIAKFTAILLTSNILSTACFAQGSPLFTGPSGAPAVTNDPIKKQEVVDSITAKTDVILGWMADALGNKVFQSGNLGSINLPSDGAMLRGGVTIGIPNPSGFYSNAAGVSIIMGCSPALNKSLDPSSCAGGGINGGFSAAYPAGLQQALNYGGVDRAGLFIGGVFTPPCFGSSLNQCSSGAVTLSGVRGVRVNLPAGQAVPPQYLRLNTFIQLPGLTAPLEGMMVAWDPAGTWVQVSGWGDPITRVVGVDATSYSLASGVTQLSAIVGYSLTDFGIDTVNASVIGGAQVAKGAESDLGCMLTTNCPFNYGLSVNGFGTQQNGSAFSANGSVGTPTTEWPDGFPAFNDGIELRSFGYRGLLLDMDFDGNPYHNAVAGLYINGRGNLPIVVHNPSITTPTTGNAFTVDAAGDVVGIGGFEVGSLDAVGAISANGLSSTGGLLIGGTMGGYPLVVDGTTGSPVFLIDTGGDTHTYGSAQVDGNLTAGGLIATPATWAANQGCVAGQITSDANYIYICVANGHVKHAAIVD